MAATRYFDRQSSPSVRTVTQSGGQPGPPGGDGWQLLETVDATRLPTGGIMLFVTGLVTNCQPFGTLPPLPTGHLQLCLGSDTSNLKSTVHRWDYPVGGHATIASSGAGRRFCFLIVIDSALGITDPTWSISWPETADLSLYGRLWWNQDVPTYGASWDVSDLDITWAHLDDIPTAEKHGWTEPQFQLPPGATSKTDPVSFGGVDETWLTFGALYTLPGGNSPGVPFGYVTYGIEEVGGRVMGTDGIVGGNLGLAIWPGQPLTASRRSTDGVHYSRRMSGANQPVVSFDLNGGTGTNITRVERMAWFSIRLDALSPVLHRADLDVPGFVEYESVSVSSTRELALEVGTGTLTFEPFVFASMVVNQTTANALRPHGLRLSDADGEVYSTPVRWVHGGPFVEPAQLLASSNGIGYGDPGYRYRLQCVRPEPVAALYQAVSTASLVIFHPVRDPDGQAPAVPTVGAPVPLVPGSEGPPPGSATALPFEPNSSIEESVDDPREKFTAHTPYVRTWGVWLKPRRSFRLEWAPVSGADRDAIAAVVRAGSVFSMTPPGDAAISATAVERATVTDLGAGTWRVSVQVVELIYTV